MNNKALDTHLCGSIYGENRCKYLVYPTSDNETVGKKVLKKFYVYCTAEGRCRSMGCVASFTGNSPTWCPKRRELECTH